MNTETLENHKKYVERIKFYRSFGYDLEAERDFIIDNSLPLSGEILEIGTGKGHFAVALGKRGYDFVSVDLSAQEQEIARLNIQYFGLENRIKLKICDASSLPFRKQSFDVIFSVNVFHHLHSPGKVLDEIARVLKDSGKIILSDFNDKGLEIINSCHSYEGRKHDYFKHRLEEAREYFVSNKFSFREVQSLVQKVFILERGS